VVRTKEWNAAQEVMKIRILLVDDHAGVRQGIRKALEAAPRMEVVAEAETGVEALRLVERMNPNVVLLDCKLPDISGPEVARRIRDRGLPTRVLAMSAFQDEEYVWGMLSAGAKGYLLKEEALEEVVDAVQSVASGEAWYSRGVMDKVIGYSKNNGLLDNSLE
jgi:DNA-binding NarL/FixJ family response regulator